MENKYEIFINLDHITKDIYIKSFKKENYEIILDEENILFVKKIIDENINKNHEKIVLDVVKSMIKKYNREDIRNNTY